MSEDMRNLLAKPDKGIGEAVNAPAKLLRSMLLDLKINMITWDRMMRDYLTNPRSGVANNPAKRSSERSNLNRALSSTKVTWKKFTKALSVINPIQIKIEMDLMWDKRLVLPSTPPTHITYVFQGRSNALHEIWKKLVVDMGVSESTSIWNMLVERYLNDPRNKVSSNPAEKSTERGNLNKMLRNDDSFTWGGFRKALSFLGVTEAKLTLIVEHRSPYRPTLHTYVFSTGKSNQAHEHDD